jgi:hypothetical protein
MRSGANSPARWDTPQRNAIHPGALGGGISGRGSASGHQRSSRYKRGQMRPGSFAEMALLHGFGVAKRPPRSASPAARFATGRPHPPSAASSNARSNAASAGRRRDPALPRDPSVVAQTSSSASARRSRRRSSSPRWRQRKTCRAASAGSARFRSGATATAGPAQPRNTPSETPTTALAATSPTRTALTTTPSSSSAAKRQPNGAPSAKRKNEAATSPAPNAQPAATRKPKARRSSTTRRLRRAESSLKYTRACEYHSGSFGVTVTTG